MRLDLDLAKQLRSGHRTFRLRVRMQSTSDRIVIVGASGSGKSLTLKAIAGLERPDHGHVRLAGETLYDSDRRIDLPPQARGVGYVFQDYALFPHLTVRQNIACGLHRGLFNPGRRFRSDRVDYWLQTFHLEELAHQFPGELSGGQRQRTALARSLVAEPRALLLDEPFAAVDPTLRRRLRAELDELQRRLGVPMVLITHDPEDAEALGGETWVMRDGAIRRLREHAEPETRHDRPQPGGSQ
ncbi:MAG: molybdate transporter, ATP-binding protein [Pseudomonadota bacterium]|jgi:molybdate transport system ATP-binding protein